MMGGNPMYMYFCIGSFKPYVITDFEWTDET